MKKDFVTIEPSSGNYSSDNKVKLTVDENISLNNRTLTLNVVSKGGITKTVTILQKGKTIVADEYILNFKPIDKQAKITNIYSKSNYQIEIFSAENKIYKSVTIQNFRNILSNLGDKNPEINLSWIPLGGTNNCNYLVYKNPNQSVKYLTPTSEINGNVYLMLRLGYDFELSFITDVATNKYFDLRHACFLDGSPVIEIILDDEGWKVLTLWDLQYSYINNQSRNIVGNLQLNSYSSSTKVYLLDTNIGVCTELSCLVYEETMVKAAIKGSGKVNLTVTGNVNLDTEGFSRSYLHYKRGENWEDVDIQENQILKWYLTNKSEVPTIVLFIVNVVADFDKYEITSLPSVLQPYGMNIFSYNGNSDLSVAASQVRELHTSASDFYNPSL